MHRDNCLDNCLVPTDKGRGRFDCPSNNCLDVPAVEVAVAVESGQLPQLVSACVRVESRKEKK